MRHLSLCQVNYFVMEFVTYMAFCIIQFCCGVKLGRVFNGELCYNDWREMFMKQSVKKCR